MTIKVHDTLPAATLFEYMHEAKDGCSVGPNKVDTAVATKGKKIVIFGLPGAYTPTCSAQHLPGFIEKYSQFKSKGIDEIWCFATNDAFVMGAWGKEHKADGKVRMMADGSARLTQAMGLEFDLRDAGLGIRCQRFAMLLDNGVVKHVAVEAPGKFEVSSAEAVLQHC